MATKVNTPDLKVGMVVADLDRPWVDTPFLLQGFLIEDEEQIATLKMHCEFVIVDRARSVGDQFEATATAPIQPALARRPLPTAAKASEVATAKAAQSNAAPPAPDRLPPARRSSAIHPTSPRC